MKPGDILLLGMKSRVAAVERSTGNILWETQLRGGAQGGFVTLLCDGPRVFAATGGHLHCLDFRTGDLLWSNELKGYGFGLASLCLPGSASAPPTGMVADALAREQAAAAATV